MLRTQDLNAVRECIKNELYHEYRIYCPDTGLIHKVKGNYEYSVYLDQMERSPVKITDETVDFFCADINFKVGKRACVETYSDCEGPQWKMISQTLRPDKYKIRYHLKPCKDCGPESGSQRFIKDAAEKPVKPKIRQRNPLATHANFT